MQIRKETVIVTVLLLLTLLLVACGGRKTEAAEQSSAMQGDPAQGQQLFQTTCAACHGPEAMGVDGLGKGLHPSESEFVGNQSDDQLVEFIKQGRQPGEPGNTTGVAMPPKGGNPALSDEDIYHIVAWLRTLQ